MVAVGAEFSEEAGRVEDNIHQSEVGNDVEVEAAGGVDAPAEPETATRRPVHLAGHQAVGNVLHGHAPWPKLGALPNTQVFFNLVYH